MLLSRRNLIVGGLALGGAATAFGLLLTKRRGYPAGLVKDKSGLLRVKPGFEVTIIDRAGSKMSDGCVVPALPDGMGCFALGSDRLVLMRNHELSSSHHAESAYPDSPSPSEAYNAASYGGVTRVVLDKASLEVVRSELALTGTSRNCSGGSTPWGWLTCEEDTAMPHGFVFLCDHRAEGLANAKERRIDSLGRFRHEAAAIDPVTHHIYLTEDQSDGCLYRFVPRVAPMVADQTGRPAFDGHLEVLKISDGPTDTSDLGAGDKLSIVWTPIDPVAGPKDDLRARAKAMGAATFSRGEGIFPSALGGSRGEPEIYFAATSGGSKDRGQVFRLTPSKSQLEVAFEVAGDDLLDMPDNLCVGPKGHIFMAEDGEAPNGVRCLGPSGRIEALAVLENHGEVAGVTLSPAGDVLFFNLQRQGVTVALRGPFADLV